MSGTACWATSDADRASATERIGFMRIDEVSAVCVIEELDDDAHDGVTSKSDARSGSTHTKFRRRPGAPPSTDCSPMRAPSPPAAGWFRCSCCATSSRQPQLRRRRRRHQPVPPEFPCRVDGAATSDARGHHLGPTLPDGADRATAPPEVDGCAFDLGNSQRGVGPAHAAHGSSQAWARSDGRTPWANLRRARSRPAHP